jgi:hypothetical protein
MAKLADYKVDVAYAGPFVSELQAFAAPGSWTRDKTVAFTAIVEGLMSAGYRSFSSSVATIGLQRKGQSAVYRVPIGQRGALAAHAERYVHIVCIERTDNYSGRLFAFSEVSQTGQVVRSAKKRTLNDPASKQ